MLGLLSKFSFWTLCWKKQLGNCWELQNIREEFQCCYNWANSHVFSRCSFLIKYQKTEIMPNMGQQSSKVWSYTANPCSIFVFLITWRYELVLEAAKRERQRERRTVKKMNWTKTFKRQFLFVCLFSPHFVVRCHFWKKSSKKKKNWHNNIHTNLFC